MATMECWRPGLAAENPISPSSLKVPVPHSVPSSDTQGLKLVDFSAQHEPFLTRNAPYTPTNTP